jgi:death-on-curing protein
MEPIFLSLGEVLEIHQEQIERYGGSSGLRDPAGLESAVATPQATFGGEFPHTSFPAMAAVAAGVTSKARLIEIFESRCSPS